GGEGMSWFPDEPPLDVSDRCGRSFEYVEGDDPAGNVAKLDIFCARGRRKTLDAICSAPGSRWSVPIYLPIGAGHPSRPGTAPHGQFDALPGWGARPAGTGLATADGARRSGGPAPSYSSWMRAKTS